MKQFLVKVNGNSYEVTVDELGVIPESAAKKAEATPVAEEPQETPAPRGEGAPGHFGG